MGMRLGTGTRVQEWKPILGFKSRLMWAQSHLTLFVSLSSSIDPSRVRWGHGVCGHISSLPSCQRTVRDQALRHLQYAGGMMVALLVSLLVGFSVRAHQMSIRMLLPPPICSLQNVVLSQCIATFLSPRSSS